MKKRPLNNIWEFLYNSANALTMLCTAGETIMVSLHNLHALNKMATPNQLMPYKHSLQLFKV